MDRVTSAAREQPGGWRRLRASVTLAGGLILLMSGVCWAVKKPTRPAAPARAGIQALVEKLAGDGKARKQAREALEKIGRPAVPALIKACYSQNDIVRWEAVNLLGYIQDKSSLDALLHVVLEQSEPHSRWRAIWAVGTLKDERTIPRLLAALKDKDPTVVWHGAIALSSFGRREAAPYLLEGLKRPDEWDRWQAVNGLGYAGDERAVEPLIKVLETENVPLAQEAAMSLMRLKAKAAVPALVKALDHSSQDVRWRAAMALGFIGDSTAVPDLKRCLDSEQNEMVREQLKMALERLVEKGQKVETPEPQGPEK